VIFGDPTLLERRCRPLVLSGVFGAEPVKNLVAAIVAAVGIADLVPVVKLVARGDEAATIVGEVTVLCVLLVVVVVAFVLRDGGKDKGKGAAAESRGEL
jgi:hypothetical protein